MTRLRLQIAKETGYLSVNTRDRMALSDPMPKAQCRDYHSRIFTFTIKNQDQSKNVN
jgi:hypothetical protein